MLTSRGRHVIAELQISLRRWYNAIALVKLTAAGVNIRVCDTRLSASELSYRDMYYCCYPLHRVEVSCSQHSYYPRHLQKEQLCHFHGWACSKLHRNLHARLT